MEIFVKLSKKSKFVGNLPWKIEIFVKLPETSQNFSEIFPEKSFSYVKLPEKIELLSEVFL